MKTIRTLRIAAAAILAAAWLPQAVAADVASAEVAAGTELRFASLPQFVSIARVDVSEQNPERVTVEFRNAADEDIFISLWSKAGSEQVRFDELYIGDYRFHTVDMPDEVSIPARGTKRIRFGLLSDNPCNYDAESGIYNADSGNIGVALRKGGEIRFTYDVHFWRMGKRAFLNENLRFARSLRMGALETVLTGDGGFAELRYAAPVPKASPERDLMPTGEYKVSAGVVADIRCIFDAAAYREGFSLGASNRELLKRYLLQPEGLEQQQLDRVLVLACRCNCPDLAEDALRRGADAGRTFIYWDMLDGLQDGGRESTRFGTRTLLHRAALPDNYMGGATDAKTIRILELLMEAGADPGLGDSILPYLIRVEHDSVHFESVCLFLMECGLSPDEERVTPDIRPEWRAEIEKRGDTLDVARITPDHRAAIFGGLRFRRELGCPWKRVERKLGIQVEPSIFPLPSGTEPHSGRGSHYEPLAEEENEALCEALFESRRVIIHCPGQPPLELRREEAARLLKTLCGVAKWYREVIYAEEEFVRGSGIRLVFCDMDGRNLTAAFPMVHELCYSSDGYPVSLDMLVKRYLPATDPGLPLERQIKVLGHSGQEIFVFDGESFTSPDALKSRLRADVSYELYCDRKMTEAMVRELLRKLGAGIRIEQINLPTSRSLNNGRSISLPPR